MAKLAGRPILILRQQPRHTLAREATLPELESGIRYPTGGETVHGGKNEGKGKSMDRDHNTK